MSTSITRRSIWCNQQLGGDYLIAFKPIRIDTDAVIALIWNVAVLHQTRVSNALRDEGTCVMTFEPSLPV